MKAYTYSLVAGEPHMQDLIESFIQKYEKAEEAEKKFGDDFILSEEDELAHAVTQEEAIEFENFRTAQIEADIAAEIAEFGDENES